MLKFVIQKVGEEPSLEELGKSLAKEFFALKDSRCLIDRKKNIFECRLDNQVLFSLSERTIYFSPKSKITNYLLEINDSSSAFVKKYPLTNYFEERFSR